MPGCRSSPARPSGMCSLDAAVLAVAGFMDVEAVNARLSQEILQAGRQLLAVVVFDVPESDAARLLSDPRVRWVPGSLPGLLREFDRKVADRGKESVIRVGRFEIPLQPLLQTEPPID